MTNSEIIKNVMKEKNISTVKGLSAITGVSQVHLYKLIEIENFKLGKRVINKLNRTLDLELSCDSMRTDYDTLGYKLFKLRIDNNMTAEELSIKSNISISTISALERNLNKPSKITLKKLSKVFKISQIKLQELLFEN